MKFKAGDKVICVRHLPLAFGLEGLELNKCYIVADVDNNYVYITNMSGGYYPSRFKLAKPYTSQSIYDDLKKLLQGA